MRRVFLIVTCMLAIRLAYALPDPCGSTNPPTPAFERGDGRLVLVTGGAGFIGSALVELLLQLNYTVRVLDNLVTGNRAYLDGTQPGLTLWQGDVRNRHDCDMAVHGTYAVFHLAAMSKVRPSMGDPAMSDFCIDNNVVGTLNMLLSTLTLNETTRKFVYAASSTAYGSNAAPQSELLLPDLQTPYAVSKYQGELLVNMFQRVYSLPTISTRFFMVYGPRQPAEGAYAIVTGKFIEQAQNNEALTIEGDGEQSRDFVHVRDVARALVLAMQSKTAGVTVNVGTGTSYTVNEARKVAASVCIRRRAAYNAHFFIARRWRTSFPKNLRTRRLARSTSEKQRPTRAEQRWFFFLHAIYFSSFSVYRASPNAGGPGVFRN